MKIVLLNINPGPYHFVRIRALAKIIPSLTVLACYSWYRGHEWPEIGPIPGADIRVLRASAPEDENNTLSKMVVSALEEIQPDVVLSIGYVIPCMKAASRWARRHQRLSVHLNDSWFGDKKRYWPVELYKGWLCRSLFDGMFLSGVRSLEYYAGLGFSREDIWRGYDVVDNNHFSQGAARVRQQSDQVRKKLGLPEKFFLVVGRFVPEKNLLGLLDAFRVYRQRGGTWSLVVAGDGPLRDQLEKKAGAMDAVIISPWLSYDELPVYYALASCFILPSISEPWGLVVNEAMAAGLPVALSQKCGCLPELCYRGVNGMDFSPYSQEEIVRTLFYFSEKTSEALSAMGAASQNIIQQYTPETSATALLDCVTTLYLRKSMK